LNNKLFNYINECFRYANWNSVNLLRALPQIPFNDYLKDAEIYNHFGLTQSEIDHIENSIK
jgi:hypothetical protein